MICPIRSFTLFLSVYMIINLTNSRHSKHFSFVSLKRVIDPNDSPRRFFVNGNITTNLNLLPASGIADIIPWSTSYFPIKYGGLSVRYNLNENNTIGEYNTTNHTFTSQYKWTESVNKYKQPEEHKKFYSLENQTIFKDYIDENYSPAEKYDLLLGDLSYTLTNAVKNEGRKFARGGDVADWMGICHGWAPASYLAKKPVKPVTLIAADGRTNVTFLPDDIRGLVSQFWAKAKYSTDFVGTLCRKDPKKTRILSDFDTGLYEDSNCFNTNPGTLAIILANQIGIRKQNLVLDPQADAEVWNQPAFQYQIKFFNPIDKSYYTDDFNKVKIQVSDFRKYVSVNNLYNNLFDNNEAARNYTEILRYVLKKVQRNTNYFVGVNFTVNYTLENALIHFDTSMDDEYEANKYTAILELDKNDNIIGGEWTNNTHVDFIWKIDERYTALGVSDKIVKEFNGTSGELRSFTNYAITASRQSNVLKAVVNYLVEQSAEESVPITAALTVNDTDVVPASLAVNNVDVMR